MTDIERELINSALAYHDRSRTLDWAVHNAWDRLRDAVKAYRAQPTKSVGELACAHGLGTCPSHSSCVLTGKCIRQAEAKAEMVSIEGIRT